jgi:hypothetical protein
MSLPTQRWRCLDCENSQDIRVEFAPDECGFCGSKAIHRVGDQVGDHR